MKTQSNGGARYFVTFTDDYSRWCEIKFLKSKSKGINAFKVYMLMAEKQIRKRIKFVQSNNGTKYRNREFDDFLSNNGIKQRLTVLHTPEQNGITKRKNWILCETARCLLIDSGLPNSFWAETNATANYVRNRCPSSSIDAWDFEFWTRRLPKLNHTHFRV